MSRFNFDLLSPVLRVIQFVASLVGLILWAIYLSRLTISGGSALHAVLGILIAGTTWVVAAVGQYVWKRRSEKGNKKRIGGVVALALVVAAIDFCFLILFATVAGLTGPSSNSARGNGVCYAGEEEDNDNGTGGTQRQTNDAGACGQVKAVFGLAIVNIFAHGSSSALNLYQNLHTPPNPKSLAKNPLQGASNS